MTVTLSFRGYKPQLAGSTAISLRRAGTLEYYGHREGWRTAACLMPARKQEEKERARENGSGSRCSPKGQASSIHTLQPGTMSCFYCLLVRPPSNDSVSGLTHY